MKTGSILPLLAITLILSSSTLAGYALPDSNTQRSGQLCEAHHRFTYNYKFTYPDTLQVGEAVTLKITFTISGAEVTDNPYTVTAKIISDGFDTSATTLDLSTGTGTITITPQSADATITIATTLTLDGDYNRHRGYTATYKDTFTLSDFNITPTDTGATNTTDTTSNETTTTNTTQTDGTTETDYPVEVVTESLIPWYIARATGLLAFITLSLSISVAALRKINPRGYTKLFRHHHDISLISLILTAIHLANSLLDAAVWKLTILDALWINLGSQTGILLSMGVVSFYGITVVTATSLKPAAQRIKHGSWLNIHLTSYVAYAFVVLHSLYLGTDTVWGNNPLSQLYFIVFWATTLLNTVLVIYSFTRRGGRQP